MRKIIILMLIVTTTIFGSLKNYKIAPISFKGITLSEVLGILSEESGVTLIVEEKSKDKVIDIHFPKTRDLDSLLNLIATMNNLTVSRVDENSYILREEVKREDRVTFAGIIQSQNWRSGIDGAKVVILDGKNRETFTHSGGKFIFTGVEKGIYLVRIEGEGYESAGKFINLTGDESGFVAYLNPKSDKNQEEIQENSKTIGRESLNGEEIVTERIVLVNILSDDAKLMIDEIFAGREELYEKKESMYDYDLSDIKNMIEESAKKNIIPENNTTQLKEEKKLNSANYSTFKSVSFPKQNSIIVTASSEKMEIIKSLLKEMDRESMQVRISAEVIDITDSLFENLGFNWLYSKGGISDSGGREVNFFSDLSNTLLEITSFFGNRGEFLNFSLNLLKGSQDAVTTSVPSILILSGESGEFEITNEEVVSYSKESTTSGNSVVKSYSANVDRAGTILKATPTVKEDGTIYLKIEVEVSGFQKSGESINPELGEVNPKYTRRLSSTVLVKDGDTIIIGGMKKNKISSKENQVPLLSEIPIAGNLFRSSSKGEEMTELYIKLKVDITNRVIKSGVENKSGEVVGVNF